MGLFLWSDEMEKMKFVVSKKVEVKLGLTMIREEKTSLLFERKRLFEENEFFCLFVWMKWFSYSGFVSLWFFYFYFFKILHEMYL